jgi:hypothetical protein
MFNLELTLEVIKAAELLIDNTSEEDVLLFLGQTPNYIFNIVKNHRTSIAIPISGRPFGDTYNIPRREELDNYCVLLETLGVTRELFIKKDVIFIDHSHTGVSITAFARLIMRCVGLIDKYSTNVLDNNWVFRFINIVSNVQYPNWITAPDRNFINTIGYLIMPNLVAFANENTKPIGSSYCIPRSIPEYPYFKWNCPPDYSAVKEGTRCVEQLVQFYTYYRNYLTGDKEFMLSFINILSGLTTNPEHIELLNMEMNSVYVIRSVLSVKNTIPCIFKRAKSNLREY